MTVESFDEYNVAGNGDRIKQRELAHSASQFHKITRNQGSGKLSARRSELLTAF